MKLYEKIMINLKYDWKKAEAYPNSNGLKVFGTFVCGGGSTMGYKLAGFEHLGGVEIDPRMAEIYTKNHNPKHFYLEDIRDIRGQPPINLLSSPLRYECRL